MFFAGVREERLFASAQYSKNSCVVCLREGACTNGENVKSDNL